jgi:hypothetical protein
MARAAKRSGPPSQVITRPGVRGPAIEGEIESTADHALDGADLICAVLEVRAELLAL